MKFLQIALMMQNDKKLRRLYDRFFVAGMFVDTDMSGVICG